MQTPTYLFYDIETTGLNKCFDQILQFAAIRTDHQLNELSRVEINVKLNNDVIPSPAAIITHRIGVSDFSKGISEFEAMEKIHALLNTPNTISVGYNTLGFDDEFLRFSFYKNLLSPYTHQFANQCGRMDLYPITLLYYLFKPDYLTWPNNDGVTNLKLENLNTCNQLFEGQAHNAMVDVEVTLALAKKLYQDKTMWHFVTDYFKKTVDEERITNCESQLTINDCNHKIGFMVNGKIGHASQFIAPVISLGQHQHYKNQSLWLRLDTEELSLAKTDNFIDKTRIFRKRLAEPPIFLPIKDRYLNLLSDNRKNLFEKNKIWLAQNPNVFKSIAAFYQAEKYPETPERDIDAALYDIGFPSRPEESLFHQFHTAKPDGKLSIAKQFPSKIRQAQAIRILGRHFPEFLSDTERENYQTYLWSQPVDFRGEKKLTRDQTLIDIGELQKNKILDGQQQELLSELKEYFLK